MKRRTKKSKRKTPKLGAKTQAGGDTAKRPTSAESTVTGATARPTLAVLAGALLIAFNTCLLGPQLIYAPNAAEFEATFGDVLLLLVGSGLVTTAVLFALGLLVPTRKREIYAAALVGVGFLLWIQGSLLRWDYGDFNGANINWGQYRWRGWIDLAVWLAVGAAAIRFRAQIVRAARFVVPAFILLQTAVMFVGNPSAGTSNTSSDEAASKHDRVPIEACQISRNLNVFHIILDSFQTDVFLELVGDEDLTDELDGFVVYRDNAAPASQTILCVPAILSGKVYDGALLPSENYRAASREGFHNLLAEQGFVINLMPYIEMPGANPTVYFQSPRMYAWPRRTRIRQSAGFMIDLGMFRQTPHFVKRLVYNSRNWQLSRLVATPPNHVSFHQKQFFSDYIAKLEKYHDHPAYHLVHLAPPHPPYVTKPDGSYAGEALPDTRENFKTEARFVLLLFMDFVKKLKKLGAYDDAIIVLQGDHGSTFAPVFDGMEYPAPLNRLAALLAVKPASAHGKLAVSEAPTAAGDVPATIMTLLGLDHAYEGASVVGMSSDFERQRSYVTLTEDPQRGRVLERWVIDGSIYDQASFHELEPVAVKPQLRNYSWGTKLSFGVSGIGEPYLANGWQPTRAMHWSNGTTAQMRFKATPPPEDVVLTMVCFAHLVPGEVERQRMRVRLNGHFLGEHVARGQEGQQLRRVVPREWFASEVTTIDFEFPDAALLTDNRKVPTKRAMALHSFRLELQSMAN